MEPATVAQVQHDRKILKLIDKNKHKVETKLTPTPAKRMEGNINMI